MARIFIVEDHELVRSSLSILVERERDMQVSGEVDSAEAALNAFDRTACDLIMIDVSLPGMSGIELVGALRSQYPDLPCLMLSGHGEQSYVQKAFDAGAGGYVVKWDIDDLPDAIRAVLAGERYLSTRLVRD